jgi:hypothetical protein
MKDFLYLEGAYLILGSIVLLITLFVSTRPFMSKGAWKKGLFWVSLVITVMIGFHYKITTDRMETVKNAFEEGKTILCESRMQRKVSPVVYIKKSNNWSLKGDNFVSPEYVRDFFVARCIVE